MYRLYRLLLGIALTFTLIGCDGCNERNPSLAKLVERHGTVERDYSDAVGKWRSAPVGDRFQIGDGVRANRASNADLKLNNGTLFKLAPDTQLRFLEHLVSQNDAKIDLELGKTDIVVGELGLRLEFGRALAVFEPSAKATVKRDEDNIRLRIDFGRARFYDNREGNGSSTLIDSGDTLVIELGDIEMLIQIDTDTADATDPPPPAADAGVSSSPLGDTEARNETPPTDFEAAIETADFEAPLGAVITVHVAAPPVAVAFSTTELCPHGALLKAGRAGNWSGAEQVVGRFRTGRTPYRVFCYDAARIVSRTPAARGAVIVLRDKGTLRLPESAPSTFIETDGRSYKVTYQNLLPSITVRWSEAPEASAYLLKIDTPKQAPRMVTTPEPSLVLKSGFLAEGVHKLRFQTVDTKPKFARTTQIKIVFNNAAPKASIQTPSDGDFDVGDLVSVSGVAAKGWAVIADAETLQMDNDRRFQGQLVFTGRYRSIAIRLRHPDKGVHYYLRRSRQYAR